MAPIFSVMASRRIPLATMVPNSNLPNSPLVGRDSRYTPYERQLLSYFLEKAGLKPSTPKLIVMSPAGKSFLDGVSFSLPYRVGPYEIQKVWSNELDWFQAVNLDSGNLMLCKIRRSGDPRSGEISAVEARLREKEYLNAVKEVLQANIPLKPVSGSFPSGAPVGPPSVAAFDFLFYPYIDYRDCLHTFVQNKKALSEDEAKALFLEICDIVRTGHRAGVAFRDLKLRHLMWKPNPTRSGSLILSNLDNCVVLDASGADESACENQATPSYVSPEMCTRTSRNKSFSLYKVDIWCLGVILYAMVGQKKKI